MFRNKLGFAGVLISGALFSQLALAGGGATAKGSLDKELIRNVIQQRIVEVKKCYEVELEKNKALAGRVMVHFMIGVDGKVTDSQVEESTLHSPPAERCIADAVKTWEFPKPKGGTVSVSYPFVLASAESMDQNSGQKSGQKSEQNSRK